MEINRALEMNVRRYQGMHRELKQKERQLLVSMFVKGKPKDAAA